jgi:probable phosphoglycerate mutase
VTGTSVRILLARHGETVFNVEGRWQGQSDSPLTERGLAQARQLAGALHGEPIAALFSSDLGRAMATADEIGKLHGHEVIREERLREITCGDFTGLNRADIKARYGELLHRWAYHPATMRLPGGETLVEAQTRALNFFAESMPRYLDQTVVVIAHGAIGQAILVQAMGRDIASLWLKERVDNCQISRLEWTAEHGLQLIELSDTRHLADVGSLQGWRTTDSSTDAA